MIKRHWDGVIDAVLTKVTNPRSEATNAKVQRIKRLGCGSATASASATPSTSIWEGSTSTRTVWSPTRIPEAPEKPNTQEMADLFLGRNRSRSVNAFERFTVAVTAGHAREQAIMRVITPVPTSPPVSVRIDRGVTVPARASDASASRTRRPASHCACRAGFTA